MKSNHYRKVIVTVQIRLFIKMTIVEVRKCGRSRHNNPILHQEKEATNLTLRQMQSARCRALALLTRMEFLRKRLEGLSPHLTELIPIKII